MSEVAVNPNQLFDNYAKEFSLRIELLRAIGEYEKAAAEAALTKAKTLDQLERTRTTKLANDSLRFSILRIEKAERAAEREREKVKKKLIQLEHVVSGRKPEYLTTYDARLDAIRWMLAKASGVDTFAALPNGIRAGNNYFSMVQGHKVWNVSDEVSNVHRLLNWMSEYHLYFEAGSFTHQFIVNMLATTAEAQIKVVTDIEEKLKAAKKNQFDNMEELRKLLGIVE